MRVTDWEIVAHLADFADRGGARPDLCPICAEAEARGLKVRGDRAA